MLLVVISQLSPEKKKLIRKIGFGSILDLNCSSKINDIFVWLIDQLDTTSGTITFQNGFSFTITPMFVFKILGIPFGSKPVVINESNEASKFIHGVVHMESPTVEHLCALLTKDLDEESFTRIFMLLLLDAFLAPDGSNVPSSAYFNNLIHIDEIPQLDWCTFTLNWLMLQIKKFKLRRLQGIDEEIGGCKFILVVCCSFVLKIFHVVLFIFFSDLMKSKLIYVSYLTDIFLGISHNF